MAVCITRRACSLFAHFTTTNEFEYEYIAYLKIDIMNENNIWENNNKNVSIHTRKKKREENVRKKRNKTNISSKDKKKKNRTLSNRNMVWLRFSEVKHIEIDGLFACLLVALIRALVLRALHFAYKCFSVFIWRVLIGFRSHFSLRLILFTLWVRSVLYHHRWSRSSFGLAENKNN